MSAMPNNEQITLDAIDKLKPLREQLLSNLVLLSQMPAPTGKEEQRVEFMLERFALAGLSQAASDEIGNAVGVLPGTEGRRDIMICTNLDSELSGKTDHDVTVLSDRITGAGVAENTVSAAALALLPDILRMLDIKLKSNLVLVGSVKSFERGNHEGVNFFLDHVSKRPDYGIVLEGVPLGKLNHFSIGTLRGDMYCDVDTEHKRMLGTESALVVLTSVVNRMMRIRLPRKPYSVVRLGKFHAGQNYDIEPDHAELGFEVVSYDDEIINSVREEIKSIISEMSARFDVNIDVDYFFSRQAGGLAFNHPLVQAALETMRVLNIEPIQAHIASELSNFIARDIPALTLGLTTGKRRLRPSDYIDIDPIFTGIAQLLGVLLAIDEGECDES